MKTTFFFLFFKEHQKQKIQDSHIWLRCARATLSEMSHAWAGVACALHYLETTLLFYSNLNILSELRKMANSVSWQDWGWGGSLASAGNAAGGAQGTSDPKARKALCHGDNWPRKHTGPRSVHMEPSGMAETFLSLKGKERVRETHSQHLTVFCDWLTEPYKSCFSTSTFLFIAKSVLLLSLTNPNKASSCHQSLSRDTSGEFGVSWASGIRRSFSELH